MGLGEGVWGGRGVKSIVFEGYLIIRYFVIHKMENTLRERDEILMGGRN